MTSLSTASPLASEVLSWAHTQNAQEAPTNETQETRRKGFQEMSNLFMELLKNTSSNPLDGGDPAEGSKLIQGMMEGYSRLEQEDHLRSMLEAMRQNTFVQAAHLVGKKGTFAKDTFRIDKEADDVQIEIPEDWGKTTVRLDLFRLSDGQKVGQTTQELSPGLHNLNERFATLPQGEYALKAYGRDEKGNTTFPTPLVTSLIEQILLKDGVLSAASGTTTSPLQNLHGLKVAQESSPFQSSSFESSTNSISSRMSNALS